MQSPLTSGVQTVVNVSGLGKGIQATVSCKRTYNTCYMHGEW